MSPSPRYPNANYPLSYDEDDMAKADDVAVNEAGGKLTITEAGAGFGPLLEGAVTGVGVKGVSFRDGTYPNQSPQVEEEAKPEVVVTDDESE